MIYEPHAIVTIKNPQSTGTWRLFHVYKKGETLDLDKVKKDLIDALVDKGYNIGLDK